MLVDKEFHDYDYTEPKEKKNRNVDKSLLGKDKIASIFSKFSNPKTGKEEGINIAKAEKIQKEILEDKNIS